MGVLESRPAMEAIVDPWQRVERPRAASRATRAASDGPRKRVGYRARAGLASCLLNDIEVAYAGHDVAALGVLAVQLDFEAQVIQRIRIAQGIFVADHARFVELEQRLVEGLHAQLARLLHDLLDA